MADGISKGMFIAGIVIAILAASLISTVVSTQLALVQGPKGDKGDKGDTGAQGVPGVPPEGFITVSVAEFENYYGDTGANWSRITAGGGGSRYAQIHPLDTATITNITAYIFDNHSDFNGLVQLWCYNLTTDSTMLMSSVQTSITGASAQPFAVYNSTILYSKVDNQKYIYILRYFSAPGLEWVSLAGVVIGYKCEL